MPSPTMNFNSGNGGSAIPENLKTSVYANPGQVAVSPLVTANTNNSSNNNNPNTNNINNINNINNSGAQLLNTIKGNNSIGNKNSIVNNGFNMNPTNMGAFNQQNKGFTDFMGRINSNNINPAPPSTTGTGGVAHSLLQQRQQQFRMQQQQQQPNGFYSNSSAPSMSNNVINSSNNSSTVGNMIQNKIPRKSKATAFQYKGKHLEIRDVYNDTLIQEIECIRKLITKYKYIAMDTEFPGVVARPISDGASLDQQYQTLRCNVDLLKIIQLGVAFFDENGELAPECPCWQFNFQFSLEDDMFAQDSIELLQHSGIDFKEHNARGIDVHDFGELLISSGLVLMPGVTWITFHGGYDFGYLLKVLTCKPLPEGEDAFFALLRTYFPSTYDEKYMAKMGNGFQGGLNQLGEDLQVERYGQMHQAGSDSLLTGQVFFKLRDVVFGGTLRKDFESILYGLGVDRAPRMFD